MALGGLPFIQPQKGVDQGVEDERTTIGHFEEEEIGGKVGIGMPGILTDTR